MATAATAVALERRRRKVRARKLARYDYEKVFWNSTYSIGLLGLGWVAVRLGYILQGLTSFGADVVESVKSPQSAELLAYRKVWECVEGPDKIKPYTINTGFGGVVSYYRNNPEEWQRYKDAIMMKYPDAFSEKGVPVQERVKEISEIVLDQLDEFYGQWGPIMPVGAIGLHAILEYFRVKRYKKYE